jgi:DNA-binding transcriptional ArsR family regulator
MSSELMQAVLCDPAKPSLRARELLEPGEASGLAAMFKVLANESRLRLLHALERSEELCVSELAEAVGMSSQAVSNQLQRLVDRGILGTRREGTKIYYRVLDPCVTAVLEAGLCLAQEAPPARG